MTLKEACNIGYACGLETVDEAILNVEIHAPNIFPYDDAATEIYELTQEAKPYRDTGTKILSLYPEFADMKDNYLVIK